MERSRDPFWPFHPQGASRAARAAPVRSHDAAFRRPQGDVWKYRAVTAFTALHDAVQGQWEKLERYAGWSQSIGANAWRVFAIWGNVGLTPSANGYYESLSRLLTWMNEHGLVLHLVAFCDQTESSTVRLSLAAQDQHLRRVVGILDGGAALGELINEDFKNGELAERFPRAAFGGVPWTRSTSAPGLISAGPGSLLDFTTHHTGRDEDWPRRAEELVTVSRIGADHRPATMLPAIAGEPIRLDEATPADYADYVAAAELLGAGACLHGGFSTIDATHTTDLQNCVPPASGSAGDRVARAVAEIWSANIDADLASTARFVTGESAACPVRHDDADALATLAMIAGDRATAVVLRPASTHRLDLRPPWHVTRRVRNVVFCRREQQ